MSLLLSEQAIERSAACNGFAWEVGNGLARITVVTYLARELGADGTVIGLIVAAPHLAGVLRLLTPWILQRVKHRQSLALAMLICSSLALMAIPVVSQPGFLPSSAATLAALSIGWGLWHLLLYVGVVALFSWFREIVPADQIGKFLGVRERWKMIGVIVGSLLAGAFAYAWTATHPRFEHWWAYALPTFYGGAVMLASNFFLVDLPSSRLESGTSAVEKQKDEAASGFWSVWADRRFCLFLMFACWGAFANGLTQAAIGLFAPVALRLPVLFLLILESVMRVGQSAAAPWVGRWMDQHGNRQMLIVSQLLISISLVFYFPATRTAPYWIIGVYLLWIAYVGLNVGLYRTLLDLAPRNEPTRHIAWYYAATGLSVGIGAIVGGLAFEAFPRDNAWRWQPMSGVSLTRFQIFFLIGILLRTSAVLPLWNWSDAKRSAEV